MGVPSTTWGSLWLAQDPKAILDTTASGAARTDEDRIRRRRRAKVAAIAGGERRTSEPGRDEAVRRNSQLRERWTCGGGGDADGRPQTHGERKRARKKVGSSLFVWPFFSPVPF